MSKRMGWLILVVALATGMFVATSLYRRLTEPPIVVQETKEVPVVVALTPLKRGTILKAEHLQTVARPRQAVPSGAFAYPEVLVGRVVREELGAEQAIIETSLVPPQTGPEPGLAAPIRPGYRAVGVFVDTRGGVEQFLRSGDHVDVVVTFEETSVSSAIRKNNSARRMVQSKVVLQDVEVLDVPDRRREREADGTTRQFRDPNKETMPVVLALTPGDAERLSLAMQIGTIQLLKRGVADDHIEPTPGIRNDTMFADGAQQVLIEVRFAEVSRAISRNLGLDYIFQNEDFTKSHFLAGALSPQIPSTPKFTRVKSTVEDLALNSGVNELFELRKGPDLTFALNALEEKGLVRILAEPNLLAASGEEASFLAGGEFPIPVVQSTGGGTVSNSVTIEFKEFGIRLNFEPNVINDEEIRLFIEPEVSLLDFSTAAVTIAGFSIPALSTRRAMTTVQMRSDESLVIGGLLSQIDTDTDKGLPYINKIPILGKLFGSDKFKKEETELLVVVTPRLVKPSQAETTPRLSDPKTIGDTLKSHVNPPPYKHPQGDALRDAFLKSAIGGSPEGTVGMTEATIPYEPVGAGALTTEPTPPVPAPQ